ncbi:kinase-like domain-containing protein [Chytriomyces sp. MP71]|nr:kinase-like domain-containing protein [Chytriomyces sp. MP71]
MQQSRLRSNDSSGSSTVPRLDSTLRRSPTPPPLPPRPQKSWLYEGLTSEAKARAAVVSAVSSCPHFLARYSAQEVLGYGANGVCISALDNLAGRIVAIKIVYPSGKDVRIPSEVDSLRTLCSNGRLPNVIEYVDHFQDNNYFYVVTNLVTANWSRFSSDFEPASSLTVISDGFSCDLPFGTGNSDLWAWCSLHRNLLLQSQGHMLLPTTVVKHIVKNIAIAMQAIHYREFYHGDLKFENVFLDINPDRYDAPLIYLGDFGHAKRISNGIYQYGTNEMAGPELLADAPFDKQRLDGRCADIFALGLILYTLLSEDGQFPTVVKPLVSYSCLIADGASSFPLPPILDLEQEACSLIESMVCVHPDQRAAIDDVLSHPWLNSN